MDLALADGATRIFLNTQGANPAQVTPEAIAEYLLKNAAQVKRIYQYMEEHRQLDTKAIHEKLLASDHD